MLAKLRIKSGRLKKEGATSYFAASKCAWTTIKIDQIETHEPPAGEPHIALAILVIISQLMTNVPLISQLVMSSVTKKIRHLIRLKNDTKFERQ